MRRVCKRVYLNAYRIEKLERSAVKRTLDTVNTWATACDYKTATVLH
jgi:hypothetical protein